MNNALSDFVAWAEHRAPEVPPQPRTAQKLRAGTGITQTLLDMIDAQQPISTTTLCDQTGLGNKLVWGLLKNHRKSGRVHHDRSQGWTAGLSDAERAAAKLLRANGWTVCAPEGRAE